MTNAIKSSTQFKNRLTKISSATVLSDLTACMEWAVFQLQTHNNASALTAIFKVLKDIAKRPAGFTQKNMRAYLESFGLEWNKKTEAFRIATKADYSEMNPTFWNDIPKAEKVEKSDAEKAAQYVQKLNLSRAQWLEILVEHLPEEAELMLAAA